MCLRSLARQLLPPRGVRCALAAWVLIGTGASQAADWTSWRGPNHDGVCVETTAPLNWTRTQNVRWQIRPLEPGNSSPVILKDTVYVTLTHKGRRALEAIDRRTGKSRWSAGTNARDRSPSSPFNPPCTPSPVTDGERIVVWFGSEGLQAFDLEGKPLWALDLGPQRHQWGYASSPVIHGDRVFLNFGPGEKEFVVAADVKTGRELWRARGPGTPANDSYGTWSTPLVTEVGGKPQLLVALRDYFAALDLQEGTELWRCGGMGPQAKASPIVGGGIAVMSGDFRGAEIAVRLGGTGDVTDTHRLWRERPPRSRIASGIIRNGHIYGAQANGLMDCISLETGDVVWAGRQRGAGANSPIWASPILVGDLLYYLTQGGDTVIVEASPTFRIVAVNSLGEPCIATPAVAYGDLFIRTWNALWCIRSPEPTAASPLP